MGRASATVAGRGRRRMLRGHRAADSRSGISRRGFRSKNGYSLATRWAARYSAATRGKGRCGRCLRSIISADCSAPTAMATISRPFKVRAMRSARRSVSYCTAMAGGNGGRASAILRPVCPGNAGHAARSAAIISGSVVPTDRPMRSC